MLTALRLLSRRNPIALGLFITALSVTVVFAIRIALAPPHFPRPDMADPPIAGWMTPRYIAHAWHVPPDVVLDPIGITRGAYDRPPPLDRIAKDTDTRLPDLITAIETSIALHREASNE